MAQVSFIKVSEILPNYALMGPQTNVRTIHFPCLISPWPSFLHYHNSIISDFCPVDAGALHQNITEVSEQVSDERRRNNTNIKHSIDNILREARLSGITGIPLKF